MPKKKHKGSKNEKKNSSKKDKQQRKLAATSPEKESPEADETQVFTVTGEEFEKIIGEILQKPASVIPASYNVNASEYEYRHTQDFYNRRLYLYGEVLPPDEYSDLVYGMAAANIIEAIFDINREDNDNNVPVSERTPIKLYINSPGGYLVDGFAIISAIEVSKTPVHTINVGQWCSMAFLIGITGKKRFSLPNMTFLLHDGSSFAAGSTNKVQDRVSFDKHYEKKVVRPHVLKHTNIDEKTYKKIKRKELYMLPEEALVYGAIDKIVKNIDEIL